MSKNLTRKGLAFGAMLALSASALVSVPAIAAATGSVTLTPATGTGFNSITTSGITLNSTISANYAGFTTVDDTTTFPYLQEHKYIILNPDGEEITIDPAGSGVEYWTYATATGATYPTGASGSTGTVAAGTSGAADVTVTGSNVITTSATAIVVQANATPSATSNDLLIKGTSTTDDVTLTVQPFLDYSNGASTTTAKINGVNDIAGTAETIVLYAPGNVTATTTMASTLVRTNEVLTATVSYSSGVNNSMVLAGTKIVLFKDGNNIVTDEADDTGAVVDNGTAYAAGADGITHRLVATTHDDVKNVITSTSYVNGEYTLAAGNYTARAVYITTTPDIYVGAASAIADLSDGSNTDVDGVKSSVASSDDVLYAVSGSPEVQVRPGTKSVTISAQAYDSTAKLLASNIKVKAVFTARKLATGSSLSVTSAAGAMAKAADTLTAYAFTNASGIASFTVNSTNGTKLDAFDVAISVLDQNGAWVADGNSSADVDFVWTTAALSTFTAKPGLFVSGETINLDFYAKDQYGVGLDSITAGNLSVYAEAYVAGASTPTTYNKTVVTSSGKASFSFANFAAAASSQQLKAVLYAGNTAQSSPAPIYVSIYNTLALGSVTVADAYETAITYVDFVEGDTTDSVVSAAVTAAGLSGATGVTISGTVLNVNNAGQPGQAVVISAEGVLFKAGTLYAKDTITAYANEQGAFSVVAYAHEVNVKGIPVTVTAGTVSDSTLIQTTLPTDITDANLKFSVSMPANVVKNTTYAIVASMTDKWGNPVAATDPTPSTAGTDFAVSFAPAGSVEINSSANAAYKSFGKDGTVTVFLRSVKDIAGPGALTVSTGTAWTYPTTLLGAKTASGTIDAFELTDSPATAWDESAWSNSIETELEVLDVAPVASADTKVNAGTFKGYVAVYAKGHMGSKLSAKVGKDWVIVESLASNFVRIVEFTGAGVDVSVRIYIDKVLIETIPLTTK